MDFFGHFQVFICGLFIFSRVQSDKDILPALDLKDPAEYQVLPDPYVYVFEAEPTPEPGDDSSSENESFDLADRGEIKETMDEVISDLEGEIGIDDDALDEDALDLKPVTEDLIDSDEHKSFESDNLVTTLTKDVSDSEGIVAEIEDEILSENSDENDSEIADSPDGADVAAEASDIANDLLIEEFAEETAEGDEAIINMPSSPPIIPRVISETTKPDSHYQVRPVDRTKNDDSDKIDLVASSTDDKINRFELGARLLEDVIEEANEENEEQSSDDLSSDDAKTLDSSNISDWIPESPQLLAALRGLVKQQMTNEYTDEDRKLENAAKKTVIEHSKHAVDHLNPRFRTSLNEIRQKAAMESEADSVVEDVLELA